MTILKPKEIAKELGISLPTLNRRVREDSRFPIVQILGTRRFIKEKVLKYWDSKKKEDTVPIKNWSIITKVKINRRMYGIQF